MDEELDIGRRTWERAAKPIQQDAFREGFDVGRQSSFQQGFDLGYQQGYRNGFKMGYINAALRAAGELNSHEIDVLALTPYDLPHRGRCVMCPISGEAITKERIAEISSQFSNLEEVLEKQKTVTFPDEAIASLNNLMKT